MALSQILGCATMDVLMACVSEESHFDDYEEHRFKLRSEVSINGEKSSVETLVTCRKNNSKCLGGDMYYDGDEQLVHSMGNYTIEVSDGGDCDNFLNVKEQAVITAPSLIIKQHNDSFQVNYDSYRDSELQRHLMNNNFPGFDYDDFKITVEPVEKR